jgi:hypothetical protein
VPLEADAPAWARELALAYESGAHGQFVLYGNVADRFPLQGRLVSLGRWLDAQLLTGFHLVFQYDPGNGLSLLRGSERFAQWPGAEKMGPWPRDPRQAMELVTRYLRYHANLRALGRGEPEHVAVVVRGADQILPAGRQGDFEAASLASLVRDWAGEPPFVDLAFASFLLADNLNDLNPQVAWNPRVARVRVPLPEPATLATALAQLRVDSPAPSTRRRTTPTRRRRSPASPSARCRAWCACASTRSAGSAPRTGPASRRNWWKRKPAGWSSSSSPRARSPTTTRRTRSRPGCARTSPCGRPATCARCPMGYIFCAAGRHGKDLPGRMPRRRSRRAGGQAQELPRQWVGSSEATSRRSSA